MNGGSSSMKLEKDQGAGLNKGDNL